MANPITNNYYKRRVPHFPCEVVYLNPLADFDGICPVNIAWLVPLPSGEWLAGELVAHYAFQAVNHALQTLQTLQTLPAEWLV